MKKNWKKERKKTKKRRKVRKKQKKNLKKKNEKKGKVTKKKNKWERITVDYCCNPQWNVCGGTVIPPHHLHYVLIFVWECDFTVKTE